MGSDKGMLCSGGKTWAQIAVEKLRLLNIEVFISINSDQIENYGSHFPKKSIIIDNKGLAIGGPLRGILSTHLIHPEDDLMVLACDMPLMDFSLLSALIKNAKLRASKMATLYSRDGEIEPLCTLYTAEGLKRIMGQYEKGKLTRFSMKFILGLLDIQVIQVEREDWNLFSNLNSPEDI